MADSENDSNQERMLEPTPKRIEDFRKKGQIARSRDLNTLLILLAGSGMLLITGSHVLNSLADMMRAIFTLPFADAMSF